MKKYLTYFISIISFVIFVMGLYFLANIDLFLSIGFSILVLAHELGHVIALKKLGETSKGIYFLPFLGAITTHNRKSITKNEYAYIKYAGPLLGTVGVLVVFFLSFFLKDPRFLNLVFAGAIFNLINMIPITILDGYGITMGINKYMEWFGFIILIVLGIFIFQEYMLTLLLLIIFTLFTSSPAEESTGYQLHEVIFASIFIIIMVVLTISDKENFIWNISYVAFSLFAFGTYIKETCFKDKQKQKVKEEYQWLPLTQKERFIWGSKWILLTIVLIVITFYINGKI